jgi:hypothetical protein
MEVARAPLDGFGTGSEFAYMWGGKTRVDLATDGYTLHAIHSSDSVGGTLQVSEINSETLSVVSTRTAPSGVLKSDYSSGFIACGVFYAVDSFYADTTINYAWNISEGVDWDPGISWDVVGYLASTQYSSHHDTIYVYDAANLVTVQPIWGP